MTLTALVVAGGLAVSIVAAPIERLVVTVPDDALIYLGIARNLASTGRSTADGFSATNGYHPLWMAMMTALAAVIPDRELLLRAAMVVSLMLHVAASWLIGVRVTHVAGPAWGRTAALCWLLNRVALVIALQAMESTLYVVVLLVALGFHLRLAATLKAGASPPRSLLMCYGASLGFAALARTEGTIVSGIALVWLGVRLWKSRRGSALLSWGIAAATAILIILPWPLFSLWQVGTIKQDSAVMKSLWAEGLFPDAASRLRNVVDTADYFLLGTVRLMWYSLPLPALVLVSLALAAMFAAVQIYRPRGRAAIVLRTVVVPAAIVITGYGFSLVDRQIWWMGLPWLAMFLTAILGTVWLCRAIPALRRQQQIVRGVMIAVSMISVIALARKPLALAPYPWQADVLRSQVEIEQTIPRDQRIGCFNAGIPLYFGEPGRVVALDGFVSHDALRYWADRRIGDYLRDMRVTFVAGEHASVERARRFNRDETALQLEERRVFPLRDWPSGDRVLWWLRR